MNLRHLAAAICFLAALAVSASSSFACVDLDCDGERDEYAGQAE